MPQEIEVRKGTTEWDAHIYIDSTAGKFPADLNTWESRTIAVEVEDPAVVGWLRNADRKPWSVCVPRRDGVRWRGIYPDFVIFRRTPSGILPEIVDPHLLNDQDAPARAAALADYAGRHAADYNRIEMVIYEGPKDATGKRIDLMDARLRERVAKVTSHSHLKDIFDSS
jgi:type III restriction enzyme